MVRRYYAIGMIVLAVFVSAGWYFGGRLAQAIIVGVLAYFAFRIDYCIAFTGRMVGFSLATTKEQLGALVDATEGEDWSAFRKAMELRGSPNSSSK